MEVGTLVCYLGQGLARHLQWLWYRPLLMAGKFPLKVVTCEDHSPKRSGKFSTVRGLVTIS
jgi:hypothetical protein